MGSPHTSAAKGLLSTEEAPTGRVRVLLPLPLDRAYDYAVPADLDPLAPGDIVSVPLGKRSLTGVVWDADTAESRPVDAAKLKPVAHRYDVPPVPPVLRRFIDWVAAYTLSPPGAVLRMAISVPAALETPAAQIALRLPTLDAETRAALEAQAGRLTPARRRVIDWLAADGMALPAAPLAQMAGVSTAVVQGMVKAGLLEPVPLPEFADSDGPGTLIAEAAARRPTLTDDQAAAAAALVASVNAARQGAGFEVTLLDGVTGSGKTEVYFEAIAACLAAGRQALVLLPEIGLSAQWLSRFEARFGARPLVWHSDISAAERRRGWRRIAFGHAPVVVGARSALFLPLPDLGLIVVDEEHDASFKQDDGVIYQARDMAIVRARQAGCPIVLASATPSLETWRNAAQGRYRRLPLVSRFGSAGLPDIAAIDLRQHAPPRGRWISQPLADAVSARLARGEQAMLFLNRRGYAPLTLCRTCGHRIQCPNCSTWLVEHRLLGRLMCHHCGHQQRTPTECPDCGTADALAPCGPGIERLAEEAAERWPDARLGLMASDLFNGPAAMADLVRRVGAGEVDILIGTQMMAKGHHFPNLTLVGVVDADLGLAGGDLRAGERTFQVLHQVSGRAGRSDKPGQVLLQTTAPHHPVLRALVAGDRDAFIAAELEQREQFGWPPFGRLAALIVSAPQADQADQAARMLARTAPRLAGIEILGPAPAPLALLRGQHRRRFLIKADRDKALQAVLKDWLAQCPLPSAVRLTVDIDPYNFM